MWIVWGLRQGENRWEVWGSAEVKWWWGLTDKNTWIGSGSAHDIQPHVVKKSVWIELIAYIEYFEITLNKDFITAIPNWYLVLYIYTSAYILWQQPYGKHCFQLIYGFIWNPVGCAEAFSRAQGLCMVYRVKSTFASKSMWLLHHLVLIAANLSDETWGELFRALSCDDEIADGSLIPTEVRDGHSSDGGLYPVPSNGHWT